MTTAPEEDWSKQVKYIITGRTRKDGNSPPWFLIPKRIGNLIKEHAPECFEGEVVFEYVEEDNNASAAPDKLKFTKFIFPSSQ